MIIVFSILWLFKVLQDYKDTMPCQHCGVIDSEHEGECDYCNRNWIVEHSGTEDGTTNMSNKGLAL